MTARPNENLQRLRYLASELNKNHARQRKYTEMAEYHNVILELIKLGMDGAQAEEIKLYDEKSDIETKIRGMNKSLEELN